MRPGGSPPRSSPIRRARASPSPPRFIRQRPAPRTPPRRHPLSRSPPRPPAGTPRKIEAVSVDRRARARASRARPSVVARGRRAPTQTPARRVCASRRARPRATAPYRPPVDSAPERQRAPSPPTSPTCLRPPDRPRLTSGPSVPSTRLRRKMRRWRAPLRSSPSELGAARSERARAELTDARRRKLFSRSLGESQAEIRAIGGSAIPLETNCFDCVR